MATFKSAGFLKSPAKINNEAKQIYKGEFNDLPDGAIYWDPAGFKSKKSVNYRDEIFKSQEDLVKEFDEYQNKGFSLSESIKEVRKNYDTGDWSIPIAHIPDVYVVQPEQTPIADMIPRETTDSDTVKATREDDQPSIEMGTLENTSDTEGSYTYADGSYTTKSFDVVGYGVASRLEDKMILASNQIRSTESVAEQAHMTAMRQEEERQIILGTSNDTNGWSGFKDLGTNYESLDMSGSDINVLDKTRELVDEVEFQGGSRDSIVVVTDFESHRELRGELDTYTKYEMLDEDELGFGFSTLEVDGVPILKSHAITRQSNLSSGDLSMVAADMSSNYMAMLQDISVKPLAKVAPQEQFATDAYGTLVSEAPSHIQYIDET